MDRRAFLQACAGSALAGSVPVASASEAVGVPAPAGAGKRPATPPGLPAASGRAHALTLAAAPATAPLVGALAEPTPVWAFNGEVPGPTIRLRRGETLAATLVNGLPDPTTIHWHGIRLPNSMDGVPGLTQPPVPPQGRFDYRFSLPDSGTYWYHPHFSSPEQVDRGLHGALIVEDVDAPAVDRDLVWLLDDWRLDRSGRIVEDFNSFFDVAHAGRLGNTVTVNGRLAEAQELRRGERLRLRLINAANARIFALRFEGHRPWVLALDGQPLPEAPRLGPDEPLLLGPGMRADLILDCEGEAGATYRVVDGFDARRPYRLLELRYAAQPSGALAKRDAPRPPAPNPLPEPATGDGLRVPLELGGGAMSGRFPREPREEREARRQRRAAGSKEADPAWTINDHAHLSHGPGHHPEFVAGRGETVILTIRNLTRWWHPIHLHGHTWRERMRNGKPVPGQPWRDTSLLAPDDVLEVAFVADNPGDWLIHCHVLEHHAGGMGTQFRVA